MRKPKKKEDKKKEMRLMARIEALNMVLLFSPGGVMVWRAGARAGGAILIFDVDFGGELWYITKGIW